MSSCGRQTRPRWCRPYSHRQTTPSKTAAGDLAGLRPCFEGRRTCLAMHLAVDGAGDGAAGARLVARSPPARDSCFGPVEDQARHLLFLLAVVIASAMRPGVEALRQRGIPRGVGIAVHYAALAALVGGCSCSRYRERCPRYKARFLASRDQARSTRRRWSTGLKHEVSPGSSVASPSCRRATSSSSPASR